MSHVVSRSFSDCGYIAMMRPVRLPTRSTTGLLSCSRPLYSPTLPNSAHSVPTGSCRSRQPWLKNDTAMLPDSSRRVALTSTFGGRPLVRRAEMRCTVAITMASSPTWRSRMSCRLPRSTQRRG